MATAGTEMREHIKGAIVEGRVSDDGRYLQMSCVLDGDGSAEHPRTLRAWDADIVERWRRGEIGTGAVVVSYERVPIPSGRGHYRNVKTLQQVSAPPSATAPAPVAQESTIPTTMFAVKRVMTLGSGGRCAGVRGASHRVCAPRCDDGDVAVRDASEGAGASRPLDAGRVGAAAGGVSPTRPRGVGA